MARKLIIGAIGGSDLKADDPALILAAGIGRAAAEQDVILMTGGRPRPDTNRVHERAMHASKNSKNAGRLISFLPRKKDDDPQLPRCAGLSGTRHIEFATELTSMERNLLTGSTPDALIVLNGGAGTIVELAYASAAVNPIPIVFYGSLQALRVAYESEQPNPKSGKNIRLEVQLGIEQLARLFGGEAGNLISSLERQLYHPAPHSNFDISTGATITELEHLSMRIVLAALRQIPRIRNWETDAPTRFQGLPFPHGVNPHDYKHQFEELISTLSELEHGATF